MTDRPFIGPDADWITYYIDGDCGHVVVTGIYDDELLALRYGNQHHEYVRLRSYGPNVQGILEDNA